MTEKDIHKMYLQIMCDLLNESKLHNFSITDDQLNKIASKRVLEKLDQIELQNKLDQIELKNKNKPA